MTLSDHKLILIDGLIRVGLPETLKLTATSLVCALTVGIVLGIVRSFKIPVLDRILGIYAQVSRGVPVMIILLFLYATLPSGTPYWTAVLTIVIVEGAYMMEIFKGGVLSIDHGQWEAAKAMSLSLPATLVNVVIPQVLLVTLPAIIGQTVMLVKGTSVASVIGCLELTRKAQLLLPMFSSALLVYGYVLLIYFAICRTLTILGTMLEKKVVQRTMGDIHEK